MPCLARRLKGSGRKMNRGTYNFILKISIFIAQKNTLSVIKKLLKTNKRHSSNLFLPDKIKTFSILTENIQVVADSFNKYFVNIGPDLTSEVKDSSPNFSIIPRLL